MKISFQLSLQTVTFLTLATLLVISISGCREKPAVKPADVDYYTCTMHPSVRKQNPNDKCPICSMDLVPVMKKGADIQPDHGEFSVSVKRLQQIGVSFSTVEKRPFRQSIRAVGLVAYDKQRHWDYVARVEGYVQNLFVFSRGEWVEQNAPLLTIYSPDLLTTQNEFVDLLNVRDEARGKGAKSIIDSTERLVQSARERLRLWNISDAAIDEIAKTRQPREYLTLSSPFRGVVQDIGVDQGRKVMNGDHLVDIADLSMIWVWAEFYQDELPLLKMGLAITISTSSYPGDKFNGKISVVDPFMSGTLRTGRVRIDVDNPEFKLRPDMYVDVELNLDMGEGMAVPVSAVLPTGTRNVVFVDKGEGKLEPRFVELGRKYGEFYEVKSGLSETEHVVTSGNFLIDAEAKVQGALKSW
jgi:membrane fusion protein, copper/silver efflux system